MAFESSESRDRFVEGVRSAAGGAPAVMKGGAHGVHLGISTMSFQSLLQRKAELEALRCDSQNLNVLQKDTVTHDDLLLALRPATSARPISRKIAQPASLPAVNKEVSRRINANDPRPAHIAAGHSRPKAFGQRELSDLEQVCKSVCAHLGMKGWEFGARKPAGMRVPSSFWPRVTREFYGSQFTDADEPEQRRLQKKVRAYETDRTCKLHKVSDSAGPAEPGTPSTEQSRLLRFVASCLGTHERERLFADQKAALANHGIRPETLREATVSFEAKGITYFRMGTNMGSVRVHGFGNSADSAKEACLVKLFALENPPEALRLALDIVRPFVSEKHQGR